MTLKNRLTNQPFAAHPVSAESKRQAEQNLAHAQAQFVQSSSLKNTIWLGRRLAYRYRFDEAFAVYQAGIERFPDAFELQRHIGHRYISTRQFANAQAALATATQLAENKPVEVEPDGIPNAANQPTSNSHFNIWYHLGLAYYLRGMFSKAAETYQTCLTYCDHHDSLVATLDWYYMTLRRIGDAAGAARVLALLPERVELIESQSYYKRLLMYRGELAPESLLQPDDESENARLLNLATQGYGVGNWYLYNGDVAQAKAIFQQVIDTGFWSAFGYIAAENDLLTVN